MNLNKRRGARKFKNEEISKIRDLFWDGKTVSELARIYKTTRGTMNDICHKKSYRNVP